MKFCQTTPMGSSQRKWFHGNQLETMDQLPMVEEEEGKEAKPLDRTLSLESLIKVIEEEKNKTPRTERRLAGLKEALQEASNLSTQEALSLVSDLGLSPPNSPGRSLSH